PPICPPSTMKKHPSSSSVAPQPVPPPPNPPDSPLSLTPTKAKNPTEQVLTPAAQSSSGSLIFRFPVLPSACFMATSPRTGHLRATESRTRARLMRRTERDRIPGYCRRGERRQRRE
ncbi:hypothetical protein PENTCL1PPCAC_5049, partial [Pristionchus entomophagus]